MTRTVGSRIRHAREEAGLSREKLARELDSCSRTIVRWEADMHSPRVAEVVRLARALDVDAHWLAFGSSPS